MPDPSTVPHGFEIVRDEQRKRGWYLSWRCRRKTCDSSGNATTPTREAGINLFEIVAEGHRQQVEDGIHEEVGHA